jgi:hypothetical protein
MRTFYHADEHKLGSSVVVVGAQVLPGDPQALTSAAQALKGMPATENAQDGLDQGLGLGQPSSDDLHRALGHFFLGSMGMMVRSAVQEIVGDRLDQILARLPQSVFDDVPPGLGLDHAWTPVLSESSTVIELPDSDADAAVLETLESRSHCVSLSASVKGPDVGRGGDTADCCILPSGKCPSGEIWNNIIIELFMSRFGGDMERRGMEADLGVAYERNLAETWCCRFAGRRRSDASHCGISRQDQRAECGARFKRLATP